MQKIQDLNLFPFLTVFDILTETFKDFSVEMTYTDEIHLICISKGADDDQPNGALYICIGDPSHNTSLSDINRESKTVGIVFGINSTENIDRLKLGGDIKQAALDDDFFITTLKDIIGKISKTKEQDRVWLDKLIKPLQDYLYEMK